jgi:hypothetical protein
MVKVAGPAEPGIGLSTEAKAGHEWSARNQRKWLLRLRIFSPNVDAMRSSSMQYSAWRRLCYAPVSKRMVIEQIKKADDTES